VPSNSRPVRVASLIMKFTQAIIEAVIVADDGGLGVGRSNPPGRGSADVERIQHCCSKILQK